MLRRGSEKRAVGNGSLGGQPTEAKQERPYTCASLTKPQPYRHETKKKNQSTSLPCSILPGGGGTGGTGNHKKEKYEIFTAVIESKLQQKDNI